MYLTSKINLESLPLMGRSNLNFNSLYKGSKVRDSAMRHHKGPSGRLDLYNFKPDSWKDMFNTEVGEYLSAWPPILSIHHILISIHLSYYPSIISLYPSIYLIIHPSYPYIHPSILFIHPSYLSVLSVNPSTRLIVLFCQPSQ